jgi:O-succinylbenzoate synthase
VNLVAPDKRDELIADLERRTGLKIDRVEVGMIDYLKDSCIMRIYYDEPKDKGNSIEQIGRLPKA